MYNHGMCGGYCHPMNWPADDQLTMLEEQEKIMEAKLATIRHLKESLKDGKKTE